MGKMILRIDTSAAQKALRDCKRIAGRAKQLKPLADLAAKLIVKRTSLGRGVDGDKPEKLAALSTSYKAVRAGKVRFLTNKKTNQIFPSPSPPPSLSSLTSANKSNLTATRQMLNSIFGMAKTNTLIITVNDARGPDIFGDPSTITNSELIAIHEKGATISHPSGNTVTLPARPFFNLTKDQRNRLEREFRKILLRCLRQFV